MYHCKIDNAATKKLIASMILIPDVIAITRTIFYKHNCLKKALRNRVKVS